MIHYVCPRCGFETSKKSNLKTHVFRKNTCPPTLDDVPINVLQAEFEIVNDIKKFSCDCGKRFSSNSGLMYHKNRCETVKQRNMEWYQNELSNVVNTLRTLQDLADGLAKRANIVVDLAS